jgi:hypothetical protein
MTMIRTKRRRPAYAAALHAESHPPPHIDVAAKVRRLVEGFCPARPKRRRPTMSTWRSGAQSAQQQRIQVFQVDTEYLTTG